jgi:hypothetical protein
MLRLLRTAFIFIAVTAPVFSQSFMLHVSPRSAVMNGDHVTFTVEVEPLDGFSASVFLRATVPSLPLAEVTITPSSINAPYTTTARIDVRVVGSHAVAQHQVFIEGRNSGVYAYDTVTFKTAAPTFAVFDNTNSPLPHNQVGDI